MQKFSCFAPGAGTDGIVKIGIMGTGEHQKNEFVLNPAVYDLDGKFFHRGNEDLFLLMLNGW